MIYKVIGIERFEGTSKKDGRPYDFTRFYVIPKNQADRIRGLKAEQIDIWNGPYAPDISAIHPADVIDVAFSRRGYVDSCRVVDATEFPLTSL